MKKLRKNRTITVVMNSSEETTTFKCIKHKEYIRNKEYYDKFRDPRNFSEIMNGVYLIIDSPNTFHWDTYVCKELLEDKPIKAFDIINTVEIQNGDIISYRKINNPKYPLLKLTFRSLEDCKNCKKKDGIFYIPNIKKRHQLQPDTLYDALNHCYPGKSVKHGGSMYHIVSVEKSLKNKGLSFFNNIYKDIVSMIGIVKRKI